MNQSIFSDGTRWGQFGFSLTHTMEIKFGGDVTQAAYYNISCNPFFIQLQNYELDTKLQSSLWYLMLLMIAHPSQKKVFSLFRL